MASRVKKKIKDKKDQKIKEQNTNFNLKGSEKSE
jgi:hypothetical protein